MLVLFDHGTPAPLASALTEHQIHKVKDCGWDALGNGELLKDAEEAGFQVIVTTDKNIRYQQNLTQRKIALVVLGNSRWPVVKLYVDRIIKAIREATPGSYIEVEIPRN